MAVPVLVALLGQDWCGAVQDSPSPAQAEAQLSLHCPLTADKPLSCSSSCVNAMSWEAFPS